MSPVNPDKLDPPSQTLVRVGIEIDVKQGVIRIPIDKLKQIKSVCRQWVGRRSASRQQLQNLLRKLIYIHKCVHPARLFINRMLQALRKGITGQSIQLDHNFHKDLAWFNSFLSNYNGISVFDNKRTGMDVYVDASLTGLGAKWLNNVYAGAIPDALLNIVYFEMANILSAFRTWGKH